MSEVHKDTHIHTEQLNLVWCSNQGPTSLRQSMTAALSSDSQSWVSATWWIHSWGLTISMLIAQGDSSLPLCWMAWWKRPEAQETEISTHTKRFIGGDMPDLLTEVTTYAAQHWQLQHFVQKWSHDLDHLQSYQCFHGQTSMPAVDPAFHNFQGLHHHQLRQTLSIQKMQPCSKSNRQFHSVTHQIFLACSLALLQQDPSEQGNVLDTGCWPMIGKLHRGSIPSQGMVPHPYPWATIRKWIMKNMDNRNMKCSTSGA